MDRSAVLAKTCAALRSVIRDGDLKVREERHLVEDLGVDSVNMASLTIALEDEFDDMLLLNDWIASASNPTELTVSSLVDYLCELLGEDG